MQQLIKCILIAGAIGYGVARRMRRYTYAMKKVLIIEDNTEIASLLHDFIFKAGYACEIVAGGEDALRYVATHEIDIALLDIMLPGIDGFAVCSAIHKAQNTPIIVLSARGEKDDKLNALMLGADDYIEKPFDIDLLLAKMAALMRRTHGDEADTLVLGELVIDAARRQVSRLGETLALSVKEYELLLLLARNAGKTMRKEYLFAQVWGADSFSEPATLTVHIKWLREKIERDPKDPKHIVTVWGVGYRFEAIG